MAFCPIMELTADGTPVGRCWYHVTEGECPRHGDVAQYVLVHEATGHLTSENTMRKDRGLPKLPVA